MIFNSRRSPVYATRGMVATSQPLASQAGLSILMRGGNAADAAVATAAALNVTEPCSTGIGGDMFVLYYSAKTKQITALNGSGRAPSALSIDRIERDGLRGCDDTIADPYHPHCITVPGAAAGWCDFIEQHGSMTMGETLAPAIRLAEEGYPVATLAARQWKVKEAALAARGRELTINGRAPRAGELFRNPSLGRTFRALAEGGKAAYYEGEIAKAIATTVQKYGGVMTTGDIAAHTSTWETPISTTYRDKRVWECPPNGQGLTALIALNILEGFDLPSPIECTTAQYVERLHYVIEALRIAFSDARWYIADPATNPAPLSALLSKSYAAERRKLIHPHKATIDVKHGSPVAGTDTVFFTVVDGEGNSASFIISNYMGFGTNIVVDGWGFSLQNRGHNFSLNREHPNSLAPNKRPYHTIIPGMITNEADGSLFAPFGVMGGFMQPQGHAQVAMNLIDLDMNPQAALDAPRICLDPGLPSGKVLVEDGISFSVVSELARMGHAVVPVAGDARGTFGRGQVIIRRPDGVLIGGSDPRADGCAMGF
jgi:gamma-glutamyltranspeptidase/glutathione hydrolase